MGFVTALSPSPHRARPRGLHSLLLSQQVVCLPLIAPCLNSLVQGMCVLSLITAEAAGLLVLKACTADAAARVTLNHYDGFIFASLSFNFQLP